MEQVELGRSGIKVSQIGLGMWQAGGTAWGEDVRDQDCIDAMLRAYELGVNLIDTAEVYGHGHSEEVVGQAIKRMDRDELVIATKVQGDHLRYDDVLRACERSLKRLGLKEIDVYQIHWPDPWQQVPLKETMKALEKLYNEGKIRSIAVSNFAVRDLEEARSCLSSTDIVSNQVQYNLLHREIEKELLPYCQREKITVLAWGPLGEGVLTGKYNLERKPEDDIRKGHHFFKDENLLQISKLLDVLDAIGKERGKSKSQVAINWLLSKPGVVPIPGAKRPEHVEENVGAAGWSLTKEELERIEKKADEIVLDLF